MKNLFLILIILKVFLFVIYKSPKTKGYIGELKVRRKIGKNQNGKQYVINNLLFESKNQNGSCQIDHIAINKNGVFVVETKNYSGAIYGTDEDFKWTQVLGKNKNTFYSPVKQNQTHINEIRKIVGDNFPIKSVVVFTQNNSKNINSKNVCDLKNLKKVINTSFTSKKLNKREMKYIYNTINEYTQMYKVSLRRHVKNVERLKRENAIS